MTSLKPMQVSTSHEEDSQRKSRTPLSFLRRYKYFVGLLLPLFLFSAFFDGNVDSGQKSDAICHEECSALRDRRYEYFKGRDLLNPKDLVAQVSDATKDLLMKLNIDYGEDNFKNIFLEEDGRARPFLPFGDGSADRLQRKLMIKVLSVQKNLMEKESESHGCDCVNGDVGIPRGPTAETKKTSVEDDEDFLAPLETVFENYIWATGGHSAAAGHGNLFNESYTAFMERDLKDVFGAIGIDFQGRNYAMGGTGSAAEIAMCWTEIFGDDVDFFSWDYGMTDVGQPLRFMHYAYRGAISAGRPAFIGIRVNLDRGEQKKNIEVLEKNGVPIFLQDNELWTTMRNAIPNTFGLSTEEINEMPEYVRNYKCNDYYEKGEPFCEIEKYSRDICEDRQGKAPWHPGIKTHAMVGHALALFLIENLLAALEELAKMDLDYEGAGQFLKKLLRQEKKTYKNKIKTINFDGYAEKLYAWDEAIDKKIDFDPSLFFTGKSMCHTARIPSQTRYLGYLTNTDKVGGPAPFGKETFEAGVEEKEAMSDLDEMQLVWMDDKMHQADCPVAVNIDHKDSFFSTGDNWNALTFPNEAERRAYNYDLGELEGIVVIVFTSCEWGECEDGYIGPEDFNGDDKKWELRINGLPVTRLVDIGHKAFLAMGDNKHGVRFPPSDNDNYKFEIKVDDPSNHVKVSSFIVY